MSDRKAVLCGYYGKGNGGDEALLMSLLQMLPDNIEPIVLSGNPSETSQLYNVASCHRSSTFAVLNAFKESDFFIWGGGSLMQDVTSIASPVYYAGLMALAQQQGLKTIAWAQGIGPLKRSITRWMTKEVLRGCAGVSVRDNASANLVIEWGISTLLAPDPVWALESQPVKGLWDLPAPRVAVVLRPHPLLTPQRLQLLSQAIKTFQQATNTFILVVPFQPITDSAIADTIAQQLPNNSKILSLSDPRELKGLFTGVEMVIGMRLHSLIMAAAESCRCFALSYDPKVTQLMSEINIPGWELSQLPDKADTISKAWIEYYANGEALDIAQIESLKDRALLHRDLLHNIFSL
ncbi:MAG: polysaccharide pyruvyl transferase CsaB [Xenococcaceae cyanobacterium MO_167.B27]|nr:polysaccharide pyruvyl transferase CsaB [Xenococcaceae cyanobacterium MO_167.B27]